MKPLLAVLLLIAALGCESGLSPDTSADARLRESLAELPVSRLQASVHSATPEVRRLTAPGKNQTDAQADSLRRLVNRFFPVGAKEAFAEHYTLVYSTRLEDVQDAKLRAYVERSKAIIDRNGGLDSFITSFMAEK